MTNPQWLDEIERILPSIQKVAESCKNSFQEKCFELLLGYALGSYDSNTGVGLGTVASTSAKYRHFLEQHGIEPAGLTQLLDFESGEILTRELGRNRAEVQRGIASLIALWHCAQDDEFTIPRDELDRHCTTFDALDEHLARNLRRTIVDGSRVFIEHEGNWRLSAPGEAYLARVIASLL